MQNNWREALRIATSWAQKKFKQHLHRDALTKTEELLLDLAGPVRITNTAIVTLPRRSNAQTQTEQNPPPHPMETSLFSDEDFPPLPRAAGTLLPDY